MADIVDPFKASPAASDGGIVDPFAPPTISPPTQAAPAPADDTGDFMRGLKRTLPEIKQLGGGTLAAIGDVTGLDSVRDYGLKVYKDQEAVLQPLQKPNDSASEAFKQVKAGNLGAGIDFLQNAAGYTTGQALESLASAGAGAAVGGLAGSAVPVAGNAAGAGIGAVGGFVAKQAVKRAVKAEAEHLVEQQIAKGVAKSEAKNLGAQYLAEHGAKDAVAKQVAGKYTAQQLGKLGGQVAGGAIGAQGLNTVMELGSVYPDAIQGANDQGRDLTPAEKAKAVGHSLAAAGLETVADLFNLSVLFRGVKGAAASTAKEGLKAATKAYAGRAAIAGGEGALREAGTEAAQSYLERTGANQSTNDADAWRDYIDSAAVGAVGGILFGAGAALHNADHAAKPVVRPFGKDKADPLRADLASAQASGDPQEVADAADALHTELVKQGRVQPQDYTPPEQGYQPAPIGYQAPEIGGQTQNSPALEPAPAVASSPDMLAPPAGPLSRVAQRGAQLFPDAQPGSMAAVANEVAAPANVDPTTGEYTPPTDEALKAQIHQSVEQQIASAGKISRTRTKQALPGIVPRRADALIDQVMAERKQGITAASYAETPSVDQPQLGSLSAVAASAVPHLGESGAAAAGGDQLGSTLSEAATSDHGQAAAPTGDLSREANPVADEPAGAQPEGLSYDEPSQLEDGDVTPPSGEPFTHERAAEIQASRHEGGKVFPVEGGFVVRVPQAAGSDQSATAPSAEASALQASGHQAGDQPAAPSVEAVQAPQAASSSVGQPSVTPSEVAGGSFATHQGEASTDQVSAATQQDQPAPAQAGGQPAPETLQSGSRRPSAKATPAPAGDQAIFVRAPKANERSGGKAMQRALGEVPPREGYEAVFKPRGEQGPGIYYAPTATAAHPQSTAPAPAAVQSQSAPVAAATPSAATTGTVAPTKGESTPASGAEAAKNVAAIYQRRYRKRHPDFTIHPEAGTDLARAVEAKDAETLRGMLGNTDNKVSRATFAEATGIKLPETKRGTLEAIDKWAGVTTQERAQKRAAHIAAVQQQEIDRKRFGVNFTAQDEARYQELLDDGRRNLRGAKLAEFESLIQRRQNPHGEAESQPKAEPSKATAADKVSDQPTNAVHVEGKASEAATPAVIGESLAKAAARTPLDLKAAKAKLLADVDAAIKTAKTMKALGVYKTAEGLKVLGDGSTVGVAEGVRQQKVIDSLPYVTFDVVGDGKFKVLASKELLQAFRLKVEASPGFKTPAKRSAGPSGPTSSTSATLRQFVEDHEWGNLHTYAAEIGQPLRYGLEAKTGKPIAYIQAQDVDVGAGIPAFVGRLAHTEGKWGVIERTTGLGIMTNLGSREAAVTAAKKAVTDRLGTPAALAMMKEKAKTAMPESERDAAWQKDRGIGKSAPVVDSAGNLAPGVVATPGPIAAKSSPAPKEAGKVKAAALENVEPSNPTFYSALAKTIDEAKGAPKRAPYGQWKGWLDGAVRRGEFKQSERDWLGLDDWIKSQGDVTKQQLADYVRANQVKVEDVVLSGPDARSTGMAALARLRNAGGYTIDEDGTLQDDEGNDVKPDDLAPELRADYDLAIAGANDEGPGVKFAAYQLPGGSNYRELLLTLPTEGSAMIEERRALAAADRERVLTPAEQKRYDELLAKTKDASTAFRSTHFDQVNIAAHIRYNERTDSAGHSLLFLEEVQSDFAQAGRKRGFGPSHEIVEQDGKFLIRDKRSGKFAETEFGPMKFSERRFAEQQMSSVENRDSVPDMPFKQTDEWAMLAFKRAVIEAAKQGKDAVAWTTGAQQAERYDLSKQVDSIVYKKNGDGTFRALATVGTQRTEFGDNIPADKLEEYVGKDVAQRIVDGGGEVRNLARTREEPRDEWKALDGDNLKVGGEGMRAFYDKILPAAVNKWAKRFGGKVGTAAVSDIGDKSYTYEGQSHSLAEVERAYAVAKQSGLNIVVSPLTGKKLHFPFNRVAVEQAMRPIVKDMQAGKSLKEAIAAHGADISESDVAEIFGGELVSTDMPATVHSLPLTPAMKEAALGGLPLFNTEQAQELTKADLSPSEQEALDRANNTSEAKDKAGNLSRAQGEADARERGFPEAIERVLGKDHASRVEYVRDAAGLPAELRDGVEARNAERDGKVVTAAVFDPATQRVFVLTSVVKTADRAVWNASHEIAGHLGLRALLGDKLDPALTIALQNPTVKQLADAIMADRSMDRSQKTLAAEEALAELAAAVRTGNYAHIESRYGVKVGDGIREQQSLKASIANFLKRLQDLLNDLFGRHVFLDEDVRALLDAAYQASHSEGAVSESSALESTAADQTNTPAFKAWFAGSKVVDADGKPLVVYHGSKSDFTTFAIPTDRPDWEGFFFTNDRNAASTYGSPSPTFLSIQNPLTADAQGRDWQEGFYVNGELTYRNEFVDEARATGHDGVVIRNTMDYGNATKSGAYPAHDVFIAFRPTQIKSATANNGNFDPSKPSILENVEPIAKRAQEHSPEVIADIEAVMNAGSDKTVLQQAKDKLAALVPAKLKDQLRPTWLAALSTDMLAELGSDYHANMQHYADFLKSMNADRNELQQQGEEVSESVRQWGSKHPEQAKDLFKLMHQATVDGVDPATKYQPLQFRFNGKLVEVNRKNVTEAVKVIRQQMRERSGDSKQDLMAEVKKLNAMLKAEPRRLAQYPALQQKWAALSPEAQDHYTTMRDAYAERSKMIEDGLVQRIEDTDAPDNHKRKLVTLIRYQFETQRLQGVYFPLQRFGQYFVSATKGDSDTFLMFESLNKLEAGVRALKQRGFRINAQGLKAQGKAVDAPSGTFVADVIEKLKSAHISEATQDDIYQMYLQALPELSMRKHAIHRQAVPGFDPDAVRGFAFNMLHGAHQIARLRYAHKLADTITLLKKQQDASRVGDHSDTRRIAAGDAILNELQLRHQWIMNPTDTKLTGLVSSFGFLYYLGLTPAAAMVNLTQTALLTFPYLAARHGPVKAMNHLLAGMRDSIRTGGHIQKQLTNADELRMHAELQRRGVLDKTQAFNLAGIAEGGLAGHNPQWAKAMQLIGLPFHKAEVVNREASSIAAYRLAREDGKSHEQAVDAAARAVNDTHFDYTNQNRARVFQSGTAKTLLMFRQYSLNMTWHLGRMLWQSTKNADPEVRTIARRNLAGVLGMSALFSGTMGLPLMSVTFGVLNAIAASFGNDDEPWDAETEFRAFLDAMFGQGAGSLIADGGVNALTGADIATRVSLSQLWFRDADRELDGRGAYYNLLEQAAGPMGGVLKNALVGKQMIDEGHTLRGIETMLPKALKDTLKAQRYAAEGVNNLRGDPLVPDVSLRDTLLQLSGFTPADVAKQYDVNRSLKNYEQAILDRRGYLLDAFAMALRTEDPDARQEVMAKIQQFNRTNPEIAITTKGLHQSMMSRARYSKDAENGISLNRKLSAKLHARVDGTD